MMAGVHRDSQVFVIKINQILHQCILTWGNRFYCK